MTPCSEATGLGPPQARRGWVPATCLAVFSLLWVGLAVAPYDRATWALENIPTVVIVGLCIASYRRFRFSDRAYVQGLCFLVLHTVGSHYTYTNMPLGVWAQQALGQSRNHYDRLVHFCFGALLFIAAEQLFVRVGPMRRRLFLAFTVIAWWSVAYELLEWVVANVVAPDQGIAFLAAQGDQWDTQKDVAVACLGASLAWAFEATRAACLRRRAAPG